MINNYSFTQENEDKITAIEQEGNDIIESFLKNKVLPNEVELEPLYHLIVLFWCNNPTSRESMKNALNRNREQIIAALKEGIGYQGDREFFIRALNGGTSSDHPKTKAIGSNYGILEQSAIYYNSQNRTGPRLIHGVIQASNTRGHSSENIT